MLRDAADFAEALRPLIERLIKEQTQNVLRVERFDVAEPGNGTVMGVRQPFGNTIFLPYSNAVSGAKEGDTVLVLWRGTLSTGKVWTFADGPAEVTIPMGEVDSSSTATVFTASVGGITELRSGVACYLKNGVVTSASGWTLNVNGLGAKPVYQSQAAATRTTTIFNVNYTALFIFNEDRVEGGCWDYFYGYNSNDNTLAYQVRDNQANKVMRSTLYRYMFAFTARDGNLVPSCGVSNSTATTKALSTESFDAFGPIYFYNYTTTIAAGGSPSASYLMLKYNACNMRYAFNVTTTQLTAKAPVYVRCAPQSDGLVKLDGNDCIVQALPTTEDGKVYIFLGYAYSAYQIEMEMVHPVYQYKSGKLQLYTGA